MKTTQRLSFTLCALLLVTIGFWACRKQDYPTKQNEELTILINKVHKWYDSSVSVKRVKENSQITVLSTTQNNIEPN